MLDELQWPALEASFLDFHLSVSNVLFHPKFMTNVMILFDDISYDVRSAYWHVNNKIKIKFIFFSEHHKKISSHVICSNFHSCFVLMEILMFSLHLMKILMVFTTKE